MADPLSDVIRSLRLLGGVFLEARFTAPWCVKTKISAEHCQPYMDAPVQLICYHLVIAGRLLVFVDGEPTMEVGSGEVVLLPRNDGHILASEMGLTAVDASELMQPPVEGGLARINHGGGGEETHVFCGFLGSEGAFHPLLATLPQAVKLDFREATSREWIEASVRFAASELEAGRLASSPILSRLSELLLVEALRRYSLSLEEGKRGWLKAINDPRIGRAIALLHRDLSTRWTSDMLAREVAMSRSAFMDRFTALVGMPPMRYMTAWRLQAAKIQLSESPMTIAQVAHSVGYESEEAFSRAFKREFGLAPAYWKNTELESRNSA